ncbi:ABC-2 transporter permease [Alkalihalobacillus sp. FSL W8-0930]
MKGLMLNQWYSVNKSFWGYLVLSVVIMGVLLIAQQDMLLTVATFIPIIFMVTPAFEVLKNETMSGWNKFVLALPLKRSQIVRSHFLFFVMLMFVGIIISVGVFVVAEFISEGIWTNAVTNSILNGIGLALILGLVAYPLTYHLGTEKSDMVLMLSVLVAIGSYFLGSFIFNWVFNNYTIAPLQNLDLDFLFSAAFALVSFVLFFLSYVITNQIYRKKEF